MATLTPFLFVPWSSPDFWVASIYTDRLNVSRKSIALLGAGLLLLDFASTSVVSAATASTHLVGEVALPFPPSLGAALVLIIFAVVSFLGLKESARIAFAVLSIHIATMTSLAIASSVHWARTRNVQLHQNWIDGAPTYTAVARQLFNGFCLGMLGLTRIECTPSYIGRIKCGLYAICTYPLSCFTLVLAIVPLEQVLEGANVLSVLAETVLPRMANGHGPLPARAPAPAFQPRTYTAPLSLILLAITLTPVVFTGNVVIDPSTAKYVKVSRASLYLAMLFHSLLHILCFR
ncbi:hypothetical protein K438DRAFT_257226 [Mycena galopus ATCC 62051]|nr:hypothetical protein K438DRAFT_257226 [Mycena galopus ATCC 62051]